MVLEELLAKSREQLLTAGEVMRPHRVGDQPGPLEHTPTASLRAQRTQRAGLRDRLAQQVAQQAAEAAFIANIVEAATKNRRNESAGTGLQQQRDDPAVPVRVL